MTQLPRHLSGAGMPDVALNVLRDASWNVRIAQNGNVLALSPDERVIVAWMPEGDATEVAPLIVTGRLEDDRLLAESFYEPLWVVRSYIHADAGVKSPEWEATFSQETPAEIIAGFFRELVKVEPLDPDRDEGDL